MPAARRTGARGAGAIAIAAAIALLACGPAAGKGGAGEIDLYVAGPLADADGARLPRGPAVGRVLATSEGRRSQGVARIEVTVRSVKRPVSTRRLECSPSCPDAGRHRFTYDSKRFGSRGQVTIRALDGAGRSISRTISFRGPPRHPPAGGPGAPPPGGAPAATIPQPAFYLTAADADGLRRQAYHAAARFARRQGKGHSLLALDFGSARLKNGQYGTSLRSTTFFTNRQIGSALQAAARGHHDNYRRGTVTIVYANSNARLLAPGPGYTPLSGMRARLAGERQARAVNRVRTFAHQEAAPGGDIEPGYEYGAPGASAARSMVAAAAAVDRAPYFDVGTAPCTARSCGRGWSVEDICAVSSGAGRRAVPEIYLSTEAEQWGAIGARCGIRSFPGVGASPIGGLTPPQSRRLLRVETNATVRDPLIVWPG